MLSVIKVFLPAALTFFIGLAITPTLSHYFYTHKLWRKNARNTDEKTEEFKEIWKQNCKAELCTPRIGGSVIWIASIITVATLFLIAVFFPSPLSQKLSFLSKNQTILPLVSFILASLLGLVDDFVQIFGKGNLENDAIWFRYLKIGFILLLGFGIGWWFYDKLGMTGIKIPFDGMLHLGWLFIPFFMFVMLCVFSGSVIDGIDGLSGGVIASIFLTYTIIAFTHNQIDLAAFCAMITGGILAFLWFNIPPARFYMGETGMIGLTATISVVAFMTNTVLLLPIIAFPLFITSLSDVIQIISKKTRDGKKVFKVAPLHHHFEAMGWPSYKVTMRYWIISLIVSLIGVIISLIS